MFFASYITFSTAVSNLGNNDQREIIDAIELFCISRSSIAEDLVSMQKILAKYLDGAINVNHLVITEVIAMSSRINDQRRRHQTSTNM
jgi:hypothetical protein